jgi:hypothetical protein
MRHEPHCACAAWAIGTLASMGFPSTSLPQPAATSVSTTMTVQISAVRPGPLRWWRLMEAMVSRIAWMNL